MKLTPIDDGRCEPVWSSSLEPLPGASEDEAGFEGLRTLHED